MSALTSYLEGMIASAKNMVNHTGGYESFSDSDAQARIDIFISTLTTMQSTYGKTFNFTSYINRLKDLSPPDNLALSSQYDETFAGSSALVKLTGISGLAAGDVLGLHSLGLSKVELLDANKKVLATSKVSADLERVALTLPAKFDSSKNVYLKVYGTSGDDFGLVPYEVDDPASTELAAGATASGEIQFTGDKDKFQLQDTAGFASLAEGGAGEWRVEVSGADVGNLTAKFGAAAGAKLGKFALADGKLVADVGRAGAAAISKPLALEIAAKKGVAVKADEIGYSVGFTSDDYAHDKSTTALLQLGSANSDSIGGKFSWSGDIDWVKLTIDSVANKTGGDTYALSGLADTAAVKFLGANGKGVDVANDQITVTKAGTYYLQVMDTAAAAGTDYALQVDLVGVAAA